MKGIRFYHGLIDARALSNQSTYLNFEPNKPNLSLKGTTRHNAPTISENEKNRLAIVHG